MKKLIGTFALFLATIGLVAGCASTGVKRADKLDTSVETTRSGLEQTKVLVNETLDSLATLQLESTVLADAYPKFKKDVKAVADAAAQLKKNSAAMQDAAKVKFDAWKAQLETITNEKIKKSSMKQMNAAIAKNEALIKRLKESETVMDPFVSDLNDIVKYLDLDLSKGGFKKISGFNGPVKKADKDGQKLQKWIDNVVEELAKAKSAPPAA